MMDVNKTCRKAANCKGKIYLLFSMLMIFQKHLLLTVFLGHIFGQITCDLYGHLMVAFQCDTRPNKLYGFTFMDV